MLTNTFIGCLVFLVNSVSLVYASHLATRRFLPGVPPSVRLVAIGTVFYALIILIFQALSPFHAITKTWVTASCLLTAVVFHFIWGEKKDLEADSEPIKAWIRDGLNSRWAALLIIGGFVVLLSFSRALLMPPLAWDCLTYHLTFAALWIKTGTLLLFQAPDQIQGCAHLPINGEIFAAWLLLPFKTDLLVNSMNFPITLLGGISCYALGRELGLKRKEASFAPALICFSPMIYAQITTEYVDNAVFTFCTAAVLFSLRYMRRGHLYDNFMCLIAGGILLGTKYTGIPPFALIFIATTLKTMSLANSTTVRKVAIIILGILMVCCFGGRKYIHNFIEAGNPLYPFSLKIFHYEIFEGYPKLEEEKELISERVKDEGLDKSNVWQREYLKFFYRSTTAGPKFLLLLILGCISLFIKPQCVSKRAWFFLGIVWTVPISLHYLDSSADIARIGEWVESSTRYLSPFIALFTIQGLFVIQKLNRYWNKMDIVLVALVAWDVLNIRKHHSDEVAVVYPLLILLLFLGIVFFSFLRKKKKALSQKTNSFDNDHAMENVQSSLWSGTSIKKWAAGVMLVTSCAGLLYMLQIYRDNTRYSYYRTHEDFHYLPRSYVSAWEFLDKPDENRTVAMARGWKVESHEWFFYPLLGRHLQNDIVYISAKDKGETPTRLDRGLLRGENFSIWIDNLKRKKVDYLLVVEPWPIELTWMYEYPNDFQLVFSEKQFKIFKYRDKTI
jgi:hypothetical protein